MGNHVLMADEEVSEQAEPTPPRWSEVMVSQFKRTIALSMQDGDAPPPPEVIERVERLESRLEMRQRIDRIREATKHPDW